MLWALLALVAAEYSHEVSKLREGSMCEVKVPEAQGLPEECSCQGPLELAQLLPPLKKGLLRCFYCCDATFDDSTLLEQTCQKKCGTDEFRSSSPPPEAGQKLAGLYTKVVLARRRQRPYQAPKVNVVDSLEPSEVSTSLQSLRNEEPKRKGKEEKKDDDEAKLEEEQADPYFALLNPYE
ncbi:MAG: hypothetical protein KVP18_001780 [Porospora cf. gigantea A]|nr:MAG: hypothetical protein KVP18_001780 [Porospora cf. gigantea A]